MARIQPVLTATELALVDQMAALTGSKRTEVIKSALSVYHWFVRQALTGSQVVARKPSGEEVALETRNWQSWKAMATALAPTSWACSPSGWRRLRIRQRRRASKSGSPAA